MAQPHPGLGFPQPPHMFGATEPLGAVDPSSPFGPTPPGMQRREGGPGPGMQSPFACAGGVPPSPLGGQGCPAMQMMGPTPGSCGWGAAPPGTTGPRRRRPLAQQPHGPPQGQPPRILGNAGTAPGGWTSGEETWMEPPGTSFWGEERSDWEGGSLPPPCKANFMQGRGGGGFGGGALGPAAGTPRGPSHDQTGSPSPSPRPGEAGSGAGPGSVVSAWSEQQS